MRDESASLDSEDWQQVEQTKYDPENDDEFATSLVYAVAEAKDVDPLDHEQLPVLYDVVDAESIEETFITSPKAGQAADEGGSLSFEYAGVMITVERNGWITVYERDTA